MITLDAMRAALTKGEYFLEYLPTIDLQHRHCVGAEALIRWRRPEGVVPPGRFIPLAENTPLSGLLTYWVFDTVAAELGNWLRAHRRAYVSINVPPEILGRGGMEYVATKSGLIELSSQLILEITERGVPDQMGVEAIMNIFGRQTLVALDDVTLVGGANLAVLSRCPFHMIKLDGSLIAEIGEGRPKPSWLPGIVALQETSNLKVIAEGVETQTQAEVLQSAGIRYAQGFHFSRPVAAESFIEFHRSSGPGRPILD